jgi:hypothetical protein
MTREQARTRLLIRFGYRHALDEILQADHHVVKECRELGYNRISIILVQETCWKLPSPLQSKLHERIRFVHTGLFSDQVFVSGFHLRLFAGQSSSQRMQYCGVRVRLPARQLDKLMFWSTLVCFLPPS